MEKQKTRFAATILLAIILGILSASCKRQSREEGLLSELERIEGQLYDLDTVGVRDAFDKIAQQCDTAQDWRVSFQFNCKYGEFLVMFCDDLESSIPYLRKAYDLFPTYEAVDGDFMDAANYLSYVYIEGDQYDEAERVAADALMRGASLSDSVSGAIGLFSVLAECYEHKGDTIMPMHFHRKSQQLSILYHARMKQEEPIDRVYNRLYLMYEAMEQQYELFTKDHPAYLFLLAEYLYWITETGNTVEAQLIGEQILQIACDSALDMEPELMSVYFDLLYNYAYAEETEKIEQLLPKAMAALSKTTNQPNNDGELYYVIANGYGDGLKFDKAIEYFKLAEEHMDRQELEQLQQYINERVGYCNQYLGFGINKKKH